MSEETLRGIFSSKKEISNIYLFKNIIKKNDEMNAILIVKNLQEANNCINSFQNELLEGMGIDISILDTETVSDHNKRTNKLYICKLPLDINETKLFDVFHIFGDIMNIHILKKKKHLNTYSAFITYSHIKDAGVAIVMLDNVFQFHEEDEPISVKYAEKKVKHQIHFKKNHFSHNHNHLLQINSNYSPQNYIQNDVQPYNMVPTAYMMQSGYNQNYIPSPTFSNSHYSPISSINSQSSYSPRYSPRYANPTTPTAYSPRHGYPPNDSNQYMSQPNYMFFPTNNNELLINIHSTQNLSSIATSNIILNSAPHSNENVSLNQYNNNNIDPKLFVGSIPYYFKENDLFQLFRRYGKILEIHIIKNSKTGKSKGSAFIRFESFAAAELAISVLNGYRIPNTNINIAVRFANSAFDPSISGIPSRRIFVSGLPLTCSTNDLSNIFSKFGDIVDIHLMSDKYDHRGQSAFIRFTNKETCRKAIRECNGVFLPGINKKIFVKFANPNSFFDNDDHDSVLCNDNNDSNLTRDKDNNDEYNQMKNNNSNEEESTVIIDESNSNGENNDEFDDDIDNDYTDNEFDDDDNDSNQNDFDEYSDNDFDDIIINNNNKKNDDIKNKNNNDNKYVNIVNDSINDLHIIQPFNDNIIENEENISNKNN